MPRSKVVGGGTRLQTGIPVSYRAENPTHTKGLLLRGVVIATYVTDDPLHPKIADMLNQPITVYCDVLVYPSIPRQRWFVLEQVLVSQARGGVQSDNIWKPKATTTNLVTQVLNDTLGANPAQFDGDHVLIGFLNDSFSEPIILRASFLRAARSSHRRERAARRACRSCICFGCCPHDL